MRPIRFIFIMLLLALYSCFEDKGSYDYNRVAALTIGNVEETYSMIANIDTLILTPVVVSSAEGEISPSDPNYEYRYQISVSRKVDGVTVFWTDIETDGPNLHQVVNVKAGAYKLWLTVTDKRTGIFADHVADLVLATPTTEGWMLLGTDGADGRTRMDMISVISATRSQVATDILASRGLPEDTRGAYCIGFYPNAGLLTMDRIFVMTDNGTFTLDKDKLETSEVSTINYTDFANVDELQAPVAVWAFTGASGANMVVTTEGNAYAMGAKTSGGPRFLDKINTSVASTPAEYQLAPFVGYDATRPTPNKSVAVLYDVTNMRFMGWYSGTNSGMTTFPLKNPASGQLFDFTNSAASVKRLIWLGPSAFMRRAYAVLENKNGTVDIAGIAMQSNSFTQNVFYPGVEATATNISQATLFAFSPEYPVVYYAVGSEVYTYNLETKTCDRLAFGGEVITKLKFNRWQNTMETGGLLNKMDVPEFMAQQNQLIVCSYDESKTTNGGAFRMYAVDARGELITASTTREYFNLCRIADVVYRERR